MEENKKIQEETEPNKAEEKYEFWLVTKIKTFAKEKPKQAFFTMFGLVVLSVIISVSHLIYVRTVEVPKYNKMKQINIFKDVGDSFSEPIQATQNVLGMRDALKELEIYKIKDSLTRQDSLRIKYLIDKYSLKQK